MKTTKKRRDVARRACKNRVSRVLAVVALAAALGFGSAASTAFAQTGTPTGSQLTVSQNENLSHLEGVSSVVFSGAYALTLTDGQTLTPVFLNQTAGAILNLGNGSKTGQTWSFAANNPRWTGTTNIRSGNTLVLTPNSVENPLGAYSTDGKTASATTTIYDGATLQVAAATATATGTGTATSSTSKNETKIGKLSTAATGNSPTQNATVDVAANQTLTVENGLDVASNVGLTKTGDGVLQLLTNGTAATTSTSTGTSTGTNGSTSTSTSTASTIPAFNLGRLDVQKGTFRIADGTAKVSDATISASSISAASGATIDLRAPKTIQLAGTAGETVFSAADGSTINLYANSTGSTSYQATTFNTYINLGAATLNVVSDLKGDAALKSMTVFTTEGVGQTTYSAQTLKIIDNILGKQYVVDLTSSTSEKLVLSLQDSKKFRDVGKTPNTRAVGAYLDKKVASGNYSDAEYAFLDRLETNVSSLNLSATTGELYASSIGFSYMNNLATTQTLFAHLRDNALVGYSGSGSVAPMNYNQNGGQNGGQNAYQGGAANGYFDPGNVYYEQGNDAYGPGVAPVYDGSGAYNNGGGTVPNGSGYNFGWNGRRQTSTLATLRGQATYGDPGTLIYSAWFAALGGNVDAKDHKSAFGYDGDQVGFLTGLDLFGSCDCRFGAYYGYQDNEMKRKISPEYGKMKTKNHLVGIYHQFGDEHIYNIATVRAGYDRYDSERNISVLGTADSFTAKYNGWNAGGTFERGANFALQPFVFSPYVGVDYNFLHRDSFDEKSTTNSGYALRSKASNYNSLRGIVGGKLSLDMYPGDQQVRIAVRAAYIHEFFDPMFGKTDLRFAALSGNEFTVYGNSLGRDWALGGLGIDWAPIPAFLLFYNADILFNKYVDDVYNSVGLKFRW